ncbi:MAG TPA: fibronectin type III domain-containing protein, partial [Arthrobacter sp.]|nr:fibronectin type III domain-containing protein [Arthrobacter sp.]
PNTEVNVDGLSNELDAAGIARINGLVDLLPGGATTFGAGNIIIGGSGSDEIWGNGADDIIDGDKWLNVRLSVVNGEGAEVRTANSLTELQADIMAGKIDPGHVRIVREILSSPGAADVDTAVFSGASAEYDISTVNGVTTVAHTGGNGNGNDGTDRITNVERLRFSDQTIELVPAVVEAPAAPAAPTAAGGDTKATVTFAAPTGAETLNVVVRTGNSDFRTIEGIAATETSLVVDGLTNGTAYNFQVEAVNAGGTSPRSAASNVVTPAVAVLGPAAIASPLVTALAANTPQLGAATGPLVCGIKNGGCYQNFQGGDVHWSPSTGAQATYGAIRARWGSLDFENGKLGYPVTGENCGLKNNGCYQSFQGGDVHWSPSTGAQATYGAVRARWGSLGFETGKLGYPVAGEVCGLKNNGCYQSFQGGDVHWTASTGAQATYGAIRTFWGSRGYENGALGYPVTGETCGLADGGCFQRFQGGTINYSPARGAYLG